MDNNNSLMPGCIIFAFDATKERSDNEFKNTINGIRLQRGMIHGGHTVFVIGVLPKILHPRKCLILCFGVLDFGDLLYSLRSRVTITIVVEKVMNSGFGYVFVFRLYLDVLKLNKI